MTDWADARAVAIKPRQPNKLMTLCAVRSKPPGSHNLGTDGAFNEGGGRGFWVRRSAEHAQQPPPRARVIACEPYPRINVKVGRRETRQLGLHCLKTSKIPLDHSDPRV